MQYKKSFDNIAWEQVAPEMKQKTLHVNGKQLKLIQLQDDFIEHDWCTKAHLGLVLSGEMNIDFNGIKTPYKKNDVLTIPAGESSKHKAIIAKGKSVTLLLFEAL